jgi:hypothetical protein
MVARSGDLRRQHGCASCDRRFCRRGQPPRRPDAAARAARSRLFSGASWASPGKRDELALLPRAASASTKSRSILPTPARPDAASSNITRALRPLPQRRRREQASVAVTFSRAVDREPSPRSTIALCPDQLQAWARPGKRSSLRPGPGGTATVAAATLAPLTSYAVRVSGAGRSASHDAQGAHAPADASWDVPHPRRRAQRRVRRNDFCEAGRRRSPPTGRGRNGNATHRPQLSDRLGWPDGSAAGCGSMAWTSACKLPLYRRR